MQASSDVIVVTDTTLERYGLTLPGWQLSPPRAQSLCTQDLSAIVWASAFFVTVRAGTAYRHLFQVMKNNLATLRLLGVNILTQSKSACRPVR